MVTRFLYSFCLISSNMTIETRAALPEGSWRPDEGELVFLPCSRKVSECLWAERVFLGTQHSGTRSWPLRKASPEEGAVEAYF